MNCESVFKNLKSQTYKIFWELIYIYQWHIEHAMLKLHHHAEYLHVKDMYHLEELLLQYLIELFNLTDLFGIHHQEDKAQMACQCHRLDQKVQLQFIPLGQYPDNNNSTHKKVYHQLFAMHQSQEKKHWQNTNHF